MIDTVGLDGDDTLWNNETYFKVTQARFAELLAPYATDAADPADAGGARPNGEGANPDGDFDARLYETERANLGIFGYGIKSFTLSMVETAIAITDGRIAAADIQRIVDLGKDMLGHPVDLLDGVADVVDELAGDYRLILVTKGDLFHQESKVARSGLADRFDGVEIVSEKDEATYRRLLERHGVAPERFVMAGNSVRSDVLPVLGIGARAVHIPHELTWIHEHVDGELDVPVLASIRDLPGWLSANGGR